MLDSKNRKDPCCGECNNFQFCSHHYENNGCAEFYKDIEIEPSILEALRAVNKSKE